jgi:uncharacterized Zn finger protein
MSYYGWKPYVPVAKRRADAEKAAAKAKKAGADLAPIAPYSGAIAKTFWGKSWCQNLENYSDYANRLPRGRTYVRNGSVIDLTIAKGEVRAQVMGSSLYKIKVSVAAVGDKHWQAIGSDCSSSIDSLVELLQGKLSKAVMERICQPGIGLFPTPKEISFDCSCPDWASMCKHVAAVLYGIGARLDQQPELLFALRGVDAKDLVNQAGAGLTQSAKRPKSAKVLDDTSLADVFGIEMAIDLPAPKLKAVPKIAAIKPAKTVPAVKTEGSGKVTKKTAAESKAAKAKAPVKATAKTTVKSKTKVTVTAKPAVSPAKVTAKKVTEKSPSAARKPVVAK